MKRKSDSSIKTLSPKDGSKNSKGIRTRLSTGTLFMSGTSTISFAEAQESSSSAHSSSVESEAMTVSKQKETTPPSAHKRKLAENKDVGEFSTEPPKRRKIGRNDGTGEDNRNDYFCWICHKDGLVICCELCPRVFHAKCLSIENNVPQDWVCPECEKIMQAECTDTRSKTMSLISVSTLCTLLRYALDRMRTVGSDTFEHPLDPALFPNYSDYIFHPMSLSVLEKNIKKKNYGCTEAFLADAKWIHHNSVVYNGAQNKVTTIARAVLKVCKHEMSEIEVCPDCYYNSCVQSDSDWFCEPCRNPHPLVWAKLKGYPFWPAKALRESNDQVDVRFFGAHDRSWVPVSSCFMLSKVCPVVVKKGRGGMAEAMREVEVHIKKLREKLGTFEYAPFQTPYKSDAVYSKLKSSSVGTSDGSKHAGHGKIGKTKAGEGRLGEKQSVVSKTAMALKSKYISMSSKKGAPQTGASLKPGATQSQQVIYLKPMPKGVFLLSEQTVEHTSVKTTTHGTILRGNIPDLQLIKRISDKIQPEVIPSSSKAADSKTEDGSGNKRDLSQLNNAGVTNKMAVDAGDGESTEKGEVTLGEREGRKIVPISTTDVSLSATVTKSSVMKSVTNDKSVTDKQLSVSDTPQLVTNAPLSPKDVSVSTTDTPLSTKNISSPISDPLVQNNLLPENLETDTEIHDKQLEKSEPGIVSFPASEVGKIKNNKDDQDLENEKQNKADSSVVEVVRAQFVVVDAVLPLAACAVEVSSKSSTAAGDCAAETELHGEDSNNTPDKVSVPLSSSNQFSSKKASDQTLSTSNSEISTLQPHDEKVSASVTNRTVEFTVSKTKAHDKNEEAQVSSSEQTVRLVSSVQDNILEKTTNPIGDTLGDADIGKCVSKADEREKQCQSNQLCESDGKDLVKSSHNVSAAGSPSPCLSSISVVSSSDTCSSTTSVVTTSPGSTYKESLQKVIDSCKAKLGIDEENLNNEENDVVVLQGDEEDDSIIISDNEAEYDSDVLLMDTDEHSQELSDPASTDVANSVAEVQSSDASASLKEASTLNPATGSFEQLDADLHSEMPTEDTVTSTDKSISSKSVPDTEKTDTKELEKNTDSDKDKNTDYLDIVSRSLKKKDGRFYAVNEAPVATNFNMSVISGDQSRSPTSGVSAETSTDKTDSNPAETISVQSAPVATTVNAVSVDQTSDVIKSGDKAVSEPNTSKHSAKARETVDEASIMGYDDEYGSCADEGMTLDMEVVCSDGPEEDSDEEIVSDEEVVRTATASSSDKNIGRKTNVSSRNSMQGTMLAPGRIIIVGNKNSSDTSSSLANYTALRGALTTPSSALNVNQHSKKSSSTSSSTVSTSGGIVRAASNNNIPSTVSKMSENTEIRASAVKQKMSQLLSSKQKRKLVAKPSYIVISHDGCTGVGSGDFGHDSTESRSPRDSREENTRINASVELNGNEENAENHLNPARREGSVEQLAQQSAALNPKIESLVKNRFSLFEKFVKEQLNEMAVDVKKATEMSMPQQNDTNQQTVIEKLQAEHAKKTDDLKRALNAALKESHANFKLQKTTLATKLRIEFSKELQKAVADTKKQQWCAECWKEAVYYCCWNTSYCSYQCQQKHWPSHMPKCMQTQTQGTSSSTSQSPTIISTLNATVGTNRSSMTMSPSGLPSNIIVVPTTPSTHPTTSITPMTASKTLHRVPTVSIVSPSQWKATEEASKAKKMYSLMPQQPQTSAAISALSIGPQHFQIQYLQQQAAGSLPQQVQVMGANPPSVPLLMPSMITSQNQHPTVASPVHLLQNTSMLPLMQRPPQSSLQQQTQALGAGRYIIPTTFGAFIGPGGPV